MQALKLSPQADHIWGYLKMVVMSFVHSKDSKIEALVQGVNAGVTNKIWNLIENRNLQELSLELDSL